MQIKKKTAAIYLSIFALCVAIGSYFLSAYMQDIQISQETIQKEINKKMPFEAKSALGDVVITSANTVIKNDLIVDLNGTAYALTKKIPFQAHLSGNVIYKNKDFYFEPNNVKIDYGQIAEKSDKQSKLLNYVLEKSKEAGINDREIKQYVTNTVKNNIGKIPLYKLKPGVVRASLKDVKFKDGCVKLNISLFELAKSVLIGFFIIVIAIVMAIVLITTQSSIIIGGILFC